MRKDFAYSLLALTAMPGIANAAVVNVNIPESQKLQSTNWSGDPTVSEGTVLVAEGASISQSVGTLKPGKYTLTIEKLVSTDCDLVVNFAGQSKNIKAASTSAKLEFSLTTEQAVTIGISSAEGKSFQVTNVELKLTYDFEATYTTFNDALVKVTSLLNQIAYPEQTDLLAEAQVIQKKVDEINKSQTYATYVKYGLDGDDATNAIMGEIEALNKKGVDAVNTQYVKQLKEALAAVYDKESADVKKIVASFYNGIVNDINTFDSNNVVDDKEYQALLKRIDNKNETDNVDLKDKIRLANQTAADLQAAYDDVKAYINGTKVEGGNDYTNQWLQPYSGKYGSAYDIYTDINAQMMVEFAKDRYKNILAAAQKELSLAMQKVTQAEKDNEAALAALSYKLGNADYGLQAMLKADVDAAVDEMKSVLAKYIATRHQLDDADNKYTTVNNYLKKTENNNKVGLEVAQIKAKDTAAKNAVQAVKDAIEAANVTTAQGKIDETMAALDITELVNKANDAIAALQNTAAPYTAHMQAINTAASNKSALDNQWSSTKSKAGNYNYDGDKVSGYFASTISTIESNITKLNNAINSAKNSGKWTDDVYTYNTGFYSNTQYNDGTYGINAITSAFNKYNNEAKAAQDNYNVVVNSKDANGSATANDGLKKLQAALDAANDKVKDLAIYNDQSYNDPADPNSGYKYNYADKIAAIQAKIDAVWQQIQDAKKLKDYQHSGAMKAVALDLTIADDIKAINDDYKKDNDQLEAELKAAMLAATAATYDKLVDDINSLDGDEVKYGLSYPAVDKGRTDIKAEEAEILYGLDKDKAKTAINVADAAGLAKIQENIQTIRTKLDELLAVAKQAAELVKANQEAQAELVKAIYDDAPGSNAAGNLDKYYADNITNDALVKNATALADEANVNAVKQVNREMKTDIPKAINDLKAIVGTGNDSGTDRMKETLADNKAKHLQTIANIKARIDAAKKKAEDATANYNKYQEYAKTDGKIATTQNALNDAVAKANVADPANVDYKDKTLVIAMQWKITKADPKGATELASQYYKNSTMVANEGTVKELLDQVNDFAAGLEAKAKANKNAYDELTAEWDKVKKEWTDASTEIAKYDESSAREGFQQELKAELDKLNKNKTDYENNYKAINLPNTDRVTEQAEISAKIKDILARSLGDPNYNNRITADNANMLEVIKAAVADAAKEYNLDTDTLKMFKNVTSEVLVTSLATVEAQYTKLNNTLYQYGGANPDITFVEFVNGEYKVALKDYEATVSPVVFDKDSAYVNQIRADIAKLVEARTDFMTKIREAIATETQGKINDYETQINNVIAELKALNGYVSKISDNTAKNAVATQSDKLAKAKDAVAAGLIPEIDEAFANLKNLTNELATAKFDAMRTKLDNDIKMAEKYVEKGKEYLADDAENLAKFSNEAMDVTKARNNYNSYNTAAKLTDARFNSIENLIAEFKEYGDNTYAKILANNNAWTDIQVYVDSAQKYLDNAIAGIAEYAAAGELQQKYLDAIQKQINEAYDNYLAMNEAGTLKASDATNAKNLLDANREIQNQVKSYVATGNNTSALYTLEKAIIEANIAELEAEYNKFAASDLIDITASEAEKAVIEAIKNDFNTPSKSNTAAKLLAIQKRITTEMDKLLNANYGQGVSDAAALAELQADLTKAKNTFDKSKYTEEELSYAEGTFENETAFSNRDLNSEIEQLEAAIAAIEAELAAGKSIYYNKENIANKIAVAQKLATTIQNQAAKNKENLDRVKKEMNAAYAQLLTDKKDDGVASIAEMNKAIEDTKAEIDKNSAEVAKAASFSNLLDRLTSQVASQEQAINEAKENGVKQTSEAFAALKADNNKLNTTVEESLYDIKNTAADRELRAQAADLQAQFKAISYDEANYTLADQKSLAKQKQAIEEAINGVKDAKGNVTTNGLVQDIDAAKAQDYHLVNGTAVDAGDDTIPVTTSYVYLTTNTKVNAIQAQIDALKKDIEDLNLYPVEPQPEPAVLPGHITGGEKVTDADFDKFVNDLLAGNVPAKEDAAFAAYDANGDGSIDIADVQAIFNLSMGLNADGSDPGAAARANTSFEAGTMNVEAVKLANGNTRLNIVLNSTADYRAFQMDLNLANGMSVAEENANLQLLRSNDLGNTHRIVGYGQVENNGTMLTVDIAGAGNVQFSNIVLTTRDAKAVHFTLGEATGINSALAEKDGNVIYDLGGRLMNGLKKGFGIIRGTNGTKKVVK